MAAPIISSVTPAAWSLAPGEFVDVVVVATDPDSASGDVRFPVADGQGNVSFANVALTVEDPLTFGVAENPDGLSVQVQQISADATSATYRVTAV